MDDYISRQAVLENICTMLQNCFDASDEMIESVKITIGEMPSAQPDIVRCTDCAYCDSDVVDAPYGMTKKIFWCDRLYAGANENLVVDQDDFCSWAERREDETDRRR